ncbi:MAG: HEAT repeat domain-containing protein [Candidatus Latescibacteria bacterium]|nr:HEAT repeat domain-containing protein [Candidatus Latescibacterota bacterium]
MVSRRTWIYRLTGLFLCALLVANGCAVRRLPPIKYVPFLGKKPDSSIEAILGEALKDRNPIVRRDAVRLLGTMTATPKEQRKSAESLGRALQDREEDIRLEAVKALGNFPPEMSGPYLRKALKDESVRVRIQIVQVLKDSYQRQSSQLQAVATGQ